MKALSSHRQTEWQREAETDETMTFITGDHQCTLATDGALTIQALGSQRAVVLSPASVAELAALLGQPEVLRRLAANVVARPADGYERDPLTGLYDRSALKPLLETTLQQATRQQQPLSLMRLDIDRFKGIVDRFGWLVTERLLFDIGALLATQDGAVVIRHDDDGFTLLLPGAPVEAAYAQAEQLRPAIRQLAADYTTPGSLRTITVSVGVATFPQHGTRANTLLAAADNALRRAKWEGRDCVALARGGPEPWGPMM